MTMGLSASVFLTESSIREPKEESGDEEEALAATALARRAAKVRRGVAMDGRDQGRPRLAAGRRQRVGHGGGICGNPMAISSLLSSPRPSLHHHDFFSA
jgi:hypothetical protein